MQKYVPFIMYYGSALLLFTRKVHCLQTFWQVTAHGVIGSYLGTKFQTCSSYGFWDTGIQTEEREWQDILISCWVYIAVYKHVTQLWTC